MREWLERAAHEQHVDSGRGAGPASVAAVRRSTRRKRWSDLSPRQRALVSAAVAAQLSLQAAALLDLRGRDPRAVAGDRRLWAAASFVNFLGPIAYFAFGRR